MVNKVQGIKNFCRRLDTLFEYFVLACLVAMVVVVITQVFLREVFNFSLVWTEETSRILMVWLGFLGIAIGFRERAHIAIEFFVQRLPDGIQTMVFRFVQAAVFVFGLYLLVQGLQFTIQTSGATLPSTGLPRSVLYVVMPITGLMVCIYTALQAVGIETERHHLAVGEEHVE